MSCIRVIVADEHPVIQEGIYTILEKTPDIEPVAKTTDYQEIVALTHQFEPDVLLIDPSLFDLTPVELVAKLRQECPQTKILLFGAILDKMHLRQLVRQGIFGFVPKKEDAELLIQAIRNVADGNTWFSQAVLTDLTFGQDIQKGLLNLTTQELELLRLLAGEKTDKEIAPLMNLSERMVRYHLEKIYAKLEVKSRSGAVAQAVRLKLI